MNQALRQRLSSGAALIPSLADITPDQADVRIQSIYEAIQTTLRVPFVNYIFRLLANWPDYFDRTWQVLAPGLGTRAFERVADELRAAAALDPPPEAAGVDWSKLGALEAIRPFTDTIHYVLPKLVLVATCLDLWLAPAPADARTQGRDSERLPRAVAPGTRALAMVDVHAAPAAVRAVFDDIKRVHAHPGVASYYRGIAQWPDFLTAVWHQVRPRVISEDYQARKQALLAFAQQAIEQRLGGRSLDALTGLSQPEAVGGVMAVFRHRLTVDLLLDVGLIQGMLGGRETATRSRFSTPG